MPVLILSGQISQHSFAKTDIYQSDMTQSILILDKLHQNLVVVSALVVFSSIIVLVIS